MRQAHHGDMGVTRTPPAGTTLNGCTATYSWSQGRCERQPTSEDVLPAANTARHMMFTTSEGVK